MYLIMFPGMRGTCLSETPLIQSPNITQAPTPTLS